MDVCRLQDFEIFSDQKMAKNALFNSRHLFFDLYCLHPGQAQKVHAHGGSDKIYLVMRGTPTLTLGSEDRTLDQGEAVMAPEGVPHGVRNDGPDDAVLLVAMAPKP